MGKRIAFYTLGCKVNQFDTEAMRELFARAGYETVDFSQEADVYLVNTCTVTATGDQKSRQMISRAHSRNPQAQIIVTGCYAQRAPQEIASLPGVSLVMGSQDRGRVVELLESMGPAQATLCAVRPLTEVRSFENLEAVYENRTRAQLKIQEGCDRYCTYCVSPYARGPVRSRPLEDVRTQLMRLGENGYSEVVLTGIHLMSYGKDLGAGIGLAQAIAQGEGVPGLQRIRLGSLEPQLLSDAFVKALAENPKVCHQFHLSLQSGSPSVLRRMARRYTPEDYAACVDKLRAAMPGCAITTDIIVGFPGETEAEFAQTMAFAERIRLSRIHVFPYSPRSGTPAASMPGQVPKAIKARRARELSALAARLEAEYLESQLGICQDVLFEEEKEGGIEGYTGTYIRVWAPGGTASLGKLLPVRLLQAREGYLIGEIQQTPQ